MSQHDPLLIDMPSAMSRTVRRRTPAGDLVPDPSWHRSIWDIYEGLLGFLASRQLLADAPEVLARDFAHLVLRHSDLNQTGVALIKSGAVDRWLDSFDRSPNKAKTNYTILDRSLAKLSGSA